MKTVLFSVPLLAISLSSFAGNSVLISVSGNPHPNTIFLGAETYQKGKFIDKQETGAGNAKINIANQEGNYNPTLNVNPVGGDLSGTYAIQINPDSDSCGPILTENCQSPYAITPNCASQAWNSSNQSPLPSSLQFSYIYTGSSAEVLNFTLFCRAY